MYPWLNDLLRAVVNEPGHPLREWTFRFLLERAESPEMTAGFAVFVLYTFFNRTATEAAEEIDVPVHSVFDHVREGQDTLRALMRADPVYQQVEHWLND
jgi:hypothetical protein